MNTKNFFYKFSVLLIFSLCIPPRSFAQNTNCDAITLEEFFECYGGQAAFNPHSRQAISTFIQAEDAINAGEYAQAKTLIDNLFATYPKGNSLWWNIFDDPNGANVGTPHAYYGLRMLEEIVDYQLTLDETVEARTATMHVVLVGCSQGTQPTTEAELQTGTGPFVTNSMNAALREDNYRIVRQSFEFFSTYVTAITAGRLNIDVNVIELPQVCMQVSVSRTPPYFATGSIQPVWDALNQEIKDSTDWWWVLYPSHVPENPTFDDEAFITGGMGLDQKGGPAFIIDDKWIVRKPAHLGNGTYSDIERRIYLPQWFQHEFFHHLYRAYPELRLEVNGHDWFNRNFWAVDFEGQFEADYYAETLHKRLQQQCTPMTTKLITRVNDTQEELLTTLVMDELLGFYSLDNIQNPWHEGDMIKQGSRYFWRNRAGVQWEVQPNIAAGRLETGADSPYPGQDFFLNLYQNTAGTYIPGVTSLKFNGDLFKKRFNILRGALPLEITLGAYARFPAETTAHTGEISKNAGTYYWGNNAGERWALSPNTVREEFLLQEDSPTPGQVFDLIIAQGDCETRVLGFNYQEEYYWRPKEDPQNDAPILLTAIDDLELEENFGTFTIDLSQVFIDRENDQVLFFAKSNASTLISTEINGNFLTLSGGTLGKTTIVVMAIDVNGGLTLDEFDVEVAAVLSNEPFGTRQAIAVFPNPAGEYATVSGKLSSYTISLHSLDKSVQKEFLSSGDELRIDLNQLSPGVYFLLFTDPNKNKTLVRKIIKQ